MNKVEGKSPVLYSKLIYSEKHNKMIIMFYTKNKKKIDPFDYLNHYCYVKLVILVESIFLEKLCLQIKVHEAYIKPIKPRKSLLAIADIEEELGD